MALPRNRAQRDDEAFKENAVDLGVDRRVCVMNGPANPVPVEIVEDGSGGDVTSIYAEVSSIPTATLTDVISYTVPVGKTLFLKEVSYTGDSRAEVTIEVDASVEDKQRTTWTDWNGRFLFYNLKLVAGQVLKLRVDHCSTTTAEFSGKIIGNLL
jgi:hypothetical protein